MNAEELSKKLDPYLDLRAAISIRMDEPAMTLAWFSVPGLSMDAIMALTREAVNEATHPEEP